jgi:hypothetical protein
MNYPEAMRTLARRQAVKRPAWPEGHALYKGFAGELMIWCGSEGNPYTASDDDRKATDWIETPN